MNNKIKKKSKNTRLIFNPGDHVKIVNPLVVDYVGYPLNYEKAMGMVDKNLEPEINHFLHLCLSKLSDKTDLPLPSLTNGAGKYIYKIKHGIAYAFLQVNGFGGDMRSVHTKNLDDFEKDTEYRVISKRIVKSGKYYSPTYHYDEDGGYSEPGGLHHEKSHVLLKLCGINTLSCGFEIEAKNVIKTYDIKLDKHY